MNKLLACGLTLLILLSACASQNATTEITSAAWRDDLRYLARELPSRHINAFHTVGREAFAGEVARLDAAIPGLNGDEVLVGLMRTVALVGDGHTHLDLPPSFQRYPWNCSGSVMSCAWSRRRLPIMPRWGRACLQ